jgi:hypothetical protein
VQARVARYRQEIVAGTDIGKPIDIDRLMCPLRYDLWVRIEFISLLRDEWELYTEDLEAFLVRPESRAYRTWFKDVRCALYSPRLYHDETQVELAFIERVHQTAQLWASIERQGYDRSKPIRIGSGHTIQHVNGKAVKSTYFAGDGCHRMSCLYVTGRTHLEPDQYEVLIQRILKPLDITAMLLTKLPLNKAKYLNFISRFYCDGLQLGSAERLLQHVAANRADLLPELESVLAFDLLRIRDI